MTLFNIEYTAIILIERMEEMLLIENKKGMKVYTIKNKYLCECGLLNELKEME